MESDFQIAFWCKNNTCEHCSTHRREACENAIAKKDVEFQHLNRIGFDADDRSQKSYIRRERPPMLVDIKCRRGVYTYHPADNRCPEPFDYDEYKMPISIRPKYEIKFQLPIPFCKNHMIQEVVL